MASLFYRISDGKNHALNFAFGFSAKISPEFKAKRKKEKDRNGLGNRKDPHQEPTGILCSLPCIKCALIIRILNGSIHCLD